MKTTGITRPRALRARAMTTALFVCVGMLSLPSAQAAESTPEPTPSAPVVETEATEPTSSTKTPPAPPARVSKAFKPMKKGQRSNRVRKLESRLHQLGLHSEVITWRFDPVTRASVVAFKKKYKVPGLRGVVNKQTWETLVSLTVEPTQDALNNIYTPGTPILKPGSKGKKVRDLEARLKQLKHFKGKVGAKYDRRTRLAVRRFQTAVKIPVTGKVDARTRDRLNAATRTPTHAELYNIVVPGLDKRCATGRAICIDKTTRSLRWVVNGVVKKRMAARFGGPSTPTREGLFNVFLKSRDHVSSIYGSPMPFAMFFSGGQAVHYSPDFAKTGYNGSSHGCVNIRNRAGIAKLFDKVKIGDKVVVYRS